MPKELLNIEQVQEILGISERTVFRYIRSGDLRGFKVGKAWRFEPGDIDDFIVVRRQKAEAEQRQKREQVA